MASQGSQRERKAPERFKPVEEPKKPRRCADTEPDDMPADEEIAAQLVRCREKAVGSSVDKRRAIDETPALDTRACVDGIEAFATREEAHHQSLELYDKVYGEHVAITDIMAGIREFVREHMKYSQGNKLTPEDIYDHYDQVCGSAPHKRGSPKLQEGRTGQGP